MAAERSAADAGAERAGPAADAPTVSVVLPTYERPDLLARAMRGVLAQTYRDFELIVVDDASTESARGVVERFDDERVRFVRHEENRGNAAARNTGIRRARGEYIAFLDDDDEWLPEKLERQVPVLAESEADEALVYCARRVLREGELYRIDAPKREGDVLDDLLPWGLMACPTVVLKASALDRVGLFDETLSRGVDDDLWRRIAREYRVRYVDEVLVVCHSGHGEQVSRVETPQQIREDIHRWEDKLRKFRREFEARPASHAIALRRVGERYVQLGETATGLRHLARAALRRPLRIDTWGMLGASLFGRRGLEAFLAVKEAVMSRARPILRRLLGRDATHRYTVPRG